MRLEISDEVGYALQQRATAAGLSLDHYLARRLQQDSVIQNTEQPASVEAWIEHLRHSDSTSGRDGRPWREFIHEGHD